MSGALPPEQQNLTAHAIETYVPPPPAQRSGIALCLSGGGYRATLFHLGALRRLHELGILQQIDEITSVSGGSITNAFLAHAVATVARAGRTLSFEADVASPVRCFTSRNIRTSAILRRMLPWNWVRDDTAVRALASAYARALPDFACIGLPQHPNFVFCATDLSFGVNWVWERTRIGDYDAGYKTPTAVDAVATAVASSSCFPPIFNPLRPNVNPSELTGGRYDKPDRAKCIRGLRLTDGGNYDNLGLEPVWKRRAIVLVSDGGGPFEYSADQGFLWRVQRYSDVMYRQVGALRRRWLISNFISGQLRGTYWGVAGDVKNYDPNALGYSGEISNDLIAQIRTDLDSFSDAEAAVLENHGYALTEAGIQRHLSFMVRTPGRFRAPHEDWDWSHADRVRAALADSKHRKILGRF